MPLKTHDFYPWNSYHATTNSTRQTGDHEYRNTVAARAEALSNVFSSYEDRKLRIFCEAELSLMDWLRLEPYRLLHPADITADRFTL